MKKKNPNIKKAIDLLGGVVATQKALKLETYQTVQQWVRADSIPAKYCPSIEDLLSGKVTRKQLRPKDWEVYWPELAIKKAA